LYLLDLDSTKFLSKIRLPKTSIRYVGFDQDESLNFFRINYVNLTPVLGNLRTAQQDDTYIFVLFAALLLSKLLKVVD
jgi:hypothetical protein